MSKEVAKFNRWEVRLHRYIAKPYGQLECRQSHVDMDLWMNLKKSVSLAYYQLERSDTGYIHWQIALQTDKPLSRAIVCRLFHIDKKTEYCEPAVNWKKAVDYSQKTRTRIEGPFQYSREVPSNALTNIIDWSQKGKVRSHPAGADKVM